MPERPLSMISIKRVISTRCDGQRALRRGSRKIGDKTVLGMMFARNNTDLVNKIADQNGSMLDLTMLLRTLSRGQAFDAFQSSRCRGISRRRGVRNHFQRPFAAQMTAAAKIPPAKVLVCGAGVAGLAAIQAAKNRVPS